ncbi:hypothetical protein VSF3289_03831 [Vibrio scophthalmi]|uniref:Uncharacterized protein n=1 Tax=Vibrio scophthalmi TaxID=45658 RepID=A0A1E3WGN8_9VIBR|nr:hypothetical protein VSF3289_03831 [Vibrio scophthalmi]
MISHSNECQILIDDEADGALFFTGEHNWKQERCLWVPSLENAFL